MNVAELEKRADAAVHYLSKTDISHAHAKANMETLKDLLKTVLAYKFLDSEGSVEVRKAQSYASEEYKSHIDLIKSATEEYQTLQNKRTNAIQSIALYQTMSANTRKGNVL